MNQDDRNIDVSVVIPAYNSEHFIRECVESVIDNTLKNIEIILVDDGSTDKTAVICKEYAEKFDSVICICQNNMGQNAARLKGVLSAKGKYIGFVDSDDWIDPEMYSVLWQKAYECDADVVCCGCIYERKRSNKIQYNVLTEGVYDRERIAEQILPYVLAFGSDYAKDRLIEPHLCDKLFKRELILKELQEVDKRIIWGEDAFVTLRCISNAKRIAVIKWAPYHYRIHNDSISLEVNRKAISSYPILLENILDYCQERKLKTEQLKWYGITAARDMLRIGLGIQNHKFWLFPYADFEKGICIILYGAGMMGCCYYEQVIKNNYFSSVIWTDSNCEKARQDERICTVESIYKEKER